MPAFPAPVEIPQFAVFTGRAEVSSVQVVPSGEE